MSSRWRYFDLSSGGAAALPRSGALYALYDHADTLVYVGSTGNVQSRVIEHRQSKPSVVAVKARFGTGFYKREQALIRRLRPKFNRRITYRNQRDATR